MRQPITENVVKDTPERAHALNMEWVHQGLAFIVDENEKNPGKAKQKEEAIKEKK
ncbi:MAG TPA: hypothetical protein VLZ10_00195 [Thermodesulfobacteriota bacterium]|nr:hypothetical protein [Thermodesulfobacteriota bacterium]